MSEPVVLVEEAEGLPVVDDGFGVADWVEVAIKSIDGDYRVRRTAS